MSWRKVLLCGALAIAVVSQGTDAFGARRARRSSSGSSCYVPASSHSASSHAATGDRYLVVVGCYAVKQCRGSYFDAKTGAWYEADALVPIDCAHVGALVEVKIPACIHKVKLWISDVFASPKLGPPAGGESSASPGA